MLNFYLLFFRPHFFTLYFFNMELVVFIFLFVKFYCFDFENNFIYYAVRCNFLITYFHVFFYSIINCFHLENLNLIKKTFQIDFLNLNDNVYSNNYAYESKIFYLYCIFCIFVFIRYVLTFYTAAVRREDWFVYQDWFGSQQGYTSRLLQIFFFRTALSRREFKSFSREVNFLIHDETGNIKIIAYNNSRKDRYKAVLYYLLHQNDLELQEQNIAKQRVAYNKVRYSHLYSYLSSNKDERPFINPKK